jgi:hypothetical protein
MPVISDQRGAVMVLMAAALFPMVALLAFVVDVSHWFDYSRNLQNRADAAALAGAQELGACLGSSPGDQLTGTQSAVGRWAQLYSGAGANEPANHLPYTDAQVQATTGYKIGTYGYLNNTTAFNNSDSTSVDSPLTLKKGSLSDFYMILNGSNYHEKGGTNWTMAAPGNTATFCASNPQYDQTEVGTPGPAGAMVDVKLSQENLPLFFPLISGRPTLHAHARAYLEGEGSGPAVPIAVSDPGSTKCVTARYFRADGTQVGSDVVLTETDPANLVWTSPATTLPMAGNMYVQAFLNDCGSPPSGQTYDPNSGVLYINTYGTGTPAVDNPPQITTGGVTLDVGACNAGATGDQYFSSGGCTASVTAHVAFAPGVNKPNVTATDLSTGATLDLQASGTTWTPKGNQTFSIADLSGQHPIRIDWSQSSDTINGADCKATTCTGTFGVQAQAFGACNGCDPPDDSGPIIVARLSSGGLNNVMAYQRNQSAQVTLTLQLAGIRAAVAGAKPTVLRYGTNTNHQTGLVDCTPDGTGSGTPSAVATIYGGCGPTNPFINSGGQYNLPQLNPLYLNTRLNCTTPAPPAWPSGNHQDCVQTTPGSKSTPVPCALVVRITKQPVTANCTGGGGGVSCPANNWPDIVAHPELYKSDPRKIPMILVSPLDLASADGAPQYWLQIKKFATFYVTGWDPSLNPNCNGVNENLPNGSKQNTNSSIWGHWIDDLQPGIGNGNACDLSSPSPTTCVPVLTR